MAKLRPGILLRLSPDYDKKFRAICDFYKRDLKAQVEWWVDEEIKSMNQKGVLSSRELRGKFSVSPSKTLGKEQQSLPEKDRRAENE